MIRLIVPFAGLALCAQCACALPSVEKAEVQGNLLLVNGKPFLPVMIYHVGHWHKALPEAGVKGFNVMQAYGNSPAEFRQDVDNAFTNGMYGAVALNGLCEKPEIVEQILLACRNAPGLLCWLLEDEPNIRLGEPKDKPVQDRPFRLPPEKFKTIYDLVKRLDPNHPVWLNLAYGWEKDHAAYNSVTDIQSDDIYPVPEARLPAVAAYAEAIRAGAQGKPSWIVLQMAPVRPQMKDKDRAPTMAEVRCMTYMAFAHGMTGVGYYSFNERPGYNWRISETAPAFWAQWSDLTAELHTLAPYLLAPAAGEVKAKVLEGPQGPGPWKFAALHVSLRQRPTGLFLIAVNGLAEPVRARLTLPLDPKCKEAAVRFETRLQPVQGAAIEDRFEPYGVHLYELPQSLP
jgi:hypothetical protein